MTFLITLKFYEVPEIFRKFYNFLKLEGGVGKFSSFFSSVGSDF